MNPIARKLILVKVIAIPILILRQVQLKPGTKCLLGLSLCLSLAMVIVTIVRVSGLRNGANLDPVWDFYWQVVESCIAIIMVSLTAFRSLFVQERNRRTPSPRRSYYQRAKAFLSSKSSAETAEEVWELPPVPRGHMSGLRTLFGGNGSSSMGAGNALDDENGQGDSIWPLQKSAPRNQINLRQEISVDLESVGYNRIVNLDTES